MPSHRFYRSNKLTDVDLGLHNNMWALTLSDNKGIIAFRNDRSRRRPRSRKIGLEARSIL